MLIYLWREWQKNKARYFILLLLLSIIILLLLTTIEMALRFFYPPYHFVKQTKVDFWISKNGFEFAAPAHYRPQQLQKLQQQLRGRAIVYPLRVSQINIWGPIKNRPSNNYWFQILKKLKVLPVGNPSPTTFLSENWGSSVAFLWALNSNSLDILNLKLLLPLVKGQDSFFAPGITTSNWGNRILQHELKLGQKIIANQQKQALNNFVQQPLPPNSTLLHFYSDLKSGSKLTNEYYFSHLLISVSPGENHQEIRRILALYFPESEIKTKQQYASTIIANLLKEYWAFVYFLLAIIITTLCSLIIAANLYFVILEQRRQYALWRALGIKMRRLFYFSLLQILLLEFVACLGAFLIAGGLMQFLNGVNQIWLYHPVTISVAIIILLLIAPPSIFLPLQAVAKNDPLIIFSKEN